MKESELVLMRELLKEYLYLQKELWRADSRVQTPDSCWVVMMVAHRVGAFRFSLSRRGTTESLIRLSDQL